MLFVNGLYQARHTWEPIATALASSFECLLFDFPNQNLPQNDGVPDPAFDSPEAYGDYILAAAQEFGVPLDKLVVCGLSSGALFLRSLHLERGLDFKALVLLSVNPPELAKFHALLNIEFERLLGKVGVGSYAAMINLWFLARMAA